MLCGALLVTLRFARQVSTTLSPTNPYTTVIPLTIVFIISMVKQGVEDAKRHKADAQMNARKTTVGFRAGLHLCAVVATTAWRCCCVCARDLALLCRGRCVCGRSFVAAWQR
jgi:hypothetical protein